MKNRKKRNDIILIVCLLFIAVAAFCTVELTKEEGSFAVVIVDGKETDRYPLSEDREVIIKTSEGENTLVISDGCADITDADCKNRICVRSPKIKHGGETITCLPHRVTVIIEGGGGTDLTVK